MATLPSAGQGSPSRASESRADKPTAMVAPMKRYKRRVRSSRERASFWRARSKARVTSKTPYTQAATVQTAKR